MIAVIDASAAVEITLQRDSAAKLMVLLTEAEWVIAPSVYVAEISNVFWKYQSFTDLSQSECETHLDAAMALPDDLISDKDLYREAFKLGCTLDHSIYDMLYLVLARRHNATLLTMDKKLLRNAQESGVTVWKHPS